MRFQLRQIVHADIQAHELIPSRLADDPVGGEVKDALEGADGIFRLRAEDAVDGVDLRNGGVVLRNAVENDLRLHDIRFAAALAQRLARIGGNVAADGRVADDLDGVAVVIAQNLHGVCAGFRQRLRAPLAQAGAGDGRAVAELCRKRFHKALLPQVVVEDLVNDALHGGEVVPAVDEFLVDRRGGRDVKVVAAAAVELRVHTVEREGDDRQNVCDESAFLPSGVNFAGGDVFDVIREGDCDVCGVGVRRAEVHRDGFGNVGKDGHHGATYRFCGVMRKISVMLKTSGCSASGIRAKS